MPTLPDETPTPEIIIFDREGQILYGFQALQRIVQTQRGQPALTVRGVSIEAYIAYVCTQYPCPETAALTQGRESVTSAQLEAVSDRIDLTLADVENLKNAPDYSDEEGRP